MINEQDDICIKTSIRINKISLQVQVNHTQDIMTKIRERQRDRDICCIVWFSRVYIIIKRKKKSPFHLKITKFFFLTD